MHRTSVILVRTDQRELYANRYDVRKTNGGQLILSLLERIGSILNIEKLNTDRAYLALMTTNFHEGRSRVTTKIGEAFSEIAQVQNVVATLYDEDVEKYRPYRIMIFCNCVQFEMLNAKESLEPMENEIIIEYKGRRKRTFSLRRTYASAMPDLRKTYTEKAQVYATIKSIGWINEHTYYRLEDAHVFTEEWATRMLEKLETVEADVMYPTLSEEWILNQEDFERKVLPRELYWEKMRGTIANKDFWRWYLKIFKEAEVVFSRKFPRGKVIKG